MKKYYTGIGSRDVPPDIKPKMVHVARELEALDYWCRTGDAPGSDKVFRDATDNCDVWCVHNRRHDPRAMVLRSDDCEAFDSVAKFHPVGEDLEDYVVAIHARNYRQVIGKGEPNSECVVCWTWDGGESGGTAQAMRVAKHYGIPIFNIFYHDRYIDLLNKIKLEQQFN